MKGRGNISIVGVVEDAKYADVGTAAPPMVFLPFFQKALIAPADRTEEKEHNFIRTIEIRSRGNAALLGNEIRRALAEIDPDMPIVEMNTIGRDVDLMLNQQNVISALAGFFGVLALTLTAVGLYGLMSWLVERRTGEIGMRAALGARRGEIATMILRNTLARCAVGVAIGVPAAFAAVRLIRSQLFEISPSDPWNALGPALVVIIASAAAGYLPAARASRIEPMKALKYE
jgi:ABC-type antimicrobial peptide transport system permease subunit